MFNLLRFMRRHRVMFPQEVATHVGGLSFGTSTLVGLTGDDFLQAMLGGLGIDFQQYEFISTPIILDPQNFTIRRGMMIRSKSNAGGSGRTYKIKTAIGDFDMQVTTIANHHSMQTAVNEVYDMFRNEIMIELMFLTFDLMTRNDPQQYNRDFQPFYDMVMNEKNWRYPLNFSKVR